MFHLDAGVHLDEAEAPVFVEELEGAGAAVAHGTHGIGDALSHVCALLRRNAGGRGFFDDFLVATLHGAVAFAQHQHVAVVVAQHLEFDMARLLEELLHVHLAIAEGRQGLRAGDIDGAVQRGVGVDHAHAATAAAAGSLDDDRVADFLGDADIFFRIVA